MHANNRTIVLSANSEWNIANFRVGLIKALQSAGYVPLVIAPPHEAVEGRMKELAVERIGIKIERSGLNPYADLQLLRRYRTLLKRIRPAAYLSFTIKPNIYGSLAAASLDIPAIPNVSGLGTAFIRPGLLQQIVTHLYRFAFRRAPYVFFQNQEDCQLFLQGRMVKLEQARVLPGSGVDLDRFRPAALADGPPVFLFIGRLLRDKGVIEFVEAARRLRASFPEFRFQLLGPIDEENRTSILGSELRQWEKEGIIEYLGASDDVRPFIAAATAVVLPSYREGLPRSLLEAGAMARPLIATNVPGCRDVVDDGFNGYLCNAGDFRSLASTMERVAVLPQVQRRQMGAAARRKVHDRFSEEYVIRAYLDALANLNSAKASE